MPVFLAKNYYAEVSHQNDSKDVLKKMICLESLETTCIDDQKFYWPDLRQEDFGSYGNEKDSLDEDVESLDSGYRCSELESFAGDFENTCSEELPEDVETALLEACDEAIEMVTASSSSNQTTLFWKDDDDDVDDDIDDKRRLEDFLPLCASGDYLADYLAQLRRLDVLQKRLRQVGVSVVSDPFLTGDGEPISERLMRSIFDASNESTGEETEATSTHSKDFTELPDLLQKEPLDEEEENVFEGYCEPFRDDELFRRDAVSCVRAHVDVDVECLFFDEFDGDDAFVADDVVARARESLRSDLSYGDDSAVTAEKSSTLVLLNDDNANGDCFNASTCLIETPVSDRSPIERYSRRRVNDHLDAMSPIPMSPQPLIRILSPSTANREELSIQRRDMSYDDIAGLVFEVPPLDAIATLPRPPTVLNLMEILEVSVETLSSTLEVDLYWDPVSDSGSFVDCAMGALRDELLFESSDGNDDKEPCFLAETFCKAQPFLTFVNDDLLLREEEEEENALPPQTLASSLGIPSLRNEPEGYRKKTLQQKRRHSPPPERFRKSKQQPFPAFDPLDEFSMLRTRKAAEPSPSPPPPAREEKKAKGTFGQDGIPSITRDDVELQGSLLNVVALLERTADAPLGALRSHNVLTRRDSFQIVQLDYIRFRMREVEVRLATDDERPRDEEIYKNSYCLCILVELADLIVHCSIRSAIGHLSKTLEKRESLAVKDFLDLVLHHLTRNERNLRAQKVYHAKLNELRNLVNGHGSNGCHSSKIMILISRCFDVLSEEIGEFLTRQCNVRIASLPMSQTLQAYDCLLVSCKETLTETISWEEFDLVIYYEKQDDDNVEIARNVRVVELKTSGINSQTTALEGPVESQTGPSTNPPSTAREQMTLIASSRIVQDKKLLLALEDRYSVVVIERDYNALTAQMPYLFFADIIMDEETAVILATIDELNQPDGVKALTKKLTALSLKYVVNWLVIYRQKQAEENGAVFFESDCIAKLFACTAHLRQGDDSFKLRLVFGFGEDDVARHVRLIGDRAAAKNRRQWFTRSWITDQMTAHEAFLVSIPSISSFTAQLLLNSAPLTRLLSLRVDDLARLCPSVPLKVYKHFFTASSARSSVPYTDTSTNWLLESPSQSVEPTDIERLVPCYDITSSPLFDENSKTCVDISYGKLFLFSLFTSLGWLRFRHP